LARRYRARKSRRPFGFLYINGRGRVSHPRAHPAVVTDVGRPPVPAPLVSRAAPDIMPTPQMSHKTVTARRAGLSSQLVLMAILTNPAPTGRWPPGTGTARRHVTRTIPSDGAANHRPISRTRPTAARAGLSGAGPFLCDEP